MQNLEELPIDGAALIIVDVHPLKQVTLRAFTFPRGQEYFIVFSMVAGFQISFKGFPEAKIVSHHTHADSVFLERTRREKRESIACSPKNLLHYQIRFGEPVGSIDIAAKEFVATLIWDPQGAGIRRPL